MARRAPVSIAVAGMVGLAACSDNADNGDAAEDADETIEVEAGDLFYEGIPETLQAGTVAFELENTGEMPHDLVIEELDDETVVEETEGGESANGTIELEPGEYTIYCPIGNHREQGCGRGHPAWCAAIPEGMAPAPPGIASPGQSVRVRWGGWLGMAPTPMTR